VGRLLTANAGLGADEALTGAAAGAHHRRAAERLPTIPQIGPSLGRSRQAVQHLADVDIELYDAVQRLRFEHPEVRTVVVTSGKERIFCAGREHPDAGGVASCVEGELLQVHQRDP